MAARGAFMGMRVELRRGTILKMSPQYYPHARVKGDVLRSLEAALRQVGLAWEVLSEATVAFDGDFQPMPDIVVLDPGLMSDKTGAIPAAAVKLIVEVADASLADDMGDKRADYAAAGLVEYWVVNVQAGTVIRHADPQDGRYAVETPAEPLDGPLAMLTEPKVVAQKPA